METKVSFLSNVILGRTLPPPAPRRSFPVQFSPLPPTNATRGGQGATRCLRVSRVAVSYPARQHVQLSLLSLHFWKAENHNGPIPIAFAALEGKPALFQFPAVLSRRFKRVIGEISKPLPPLKSFANSVGEALKEFRPSINAPTRSGRKSFSRSISSLSRTISQIWFSFFFREISRYAISLPIQDSKAAPPRAFPPLM